MSLYISFLLLPLVFCFIAILLPKQSKGLLPMVASLSGFITLALSVYFHFMIVTPGEILSQDFFVANLGLHFEYRLDAISSIMVLLTSILTLGVFIATPKLMDFKDREKLFYVLVFVMQIGLLSTFLAYDLISFYIAWEVVLVPAFLLVGIFGGNNRIQATVKFFLYTLAGSLFILIAFAILMWKNSNVTNAINSVSSFSTLYKNKLEYTGIFSTQGIVGLCLMFAFFIKAPLVLFHGWLRDTYVEAPTLITVLIAGVMGKMGIYGLIRFMPLFPDLSNQISMAVMLLAAIGVIYGIFLALQSKDMKELVAYVSLSHVSGLIFGIFSLNEIGVTGSIMQMFNHGVLIGGMFFIYAYLEKNHLLQAKGLSKATPTLATSFFILTLGAIALPMTNGFVGECMILLGGFASNRVATYIALLGIIFGAAVLLKLFAKHMFGATAGVNHQDNLDMKGAFQIYLLILTVAILVIGVYPHSVFSGTEEFVRQTMSVLFR